MAHGIHIVSGPTLTPASLPTYNGRVTFQYTDVAFMPGYWGFVGHRATGPDQLNNSGYVPNFGGPNTDFSFVWDQGADNSNPVISVDVYSYVGMGTGEVFQGNFPIEWAEDPPPDPDPDPDPEPPPLPVVQDKRCFLGSAEEYKVLVMDRCGGQQVCELEGVSDLTHGRVLDDTSEAVIVIDLKGEDGGNSCCECLGGVRSWIHSVMIIRDGELVWGPGPIVNMIYRKEQVAITARDVSAWLDVRVIHEDMDFTEEDPLVVAQSIINDAMAPDDPCNVAGSTYVQVPAVLGSIDREYTSEDPVQYAGDAFRELANTAMDFTTVGNVIMMGEPLVFGPFVTLTDEDFQVEIEVEERGLEAGTKWTVQSEEAVGAAGGKDKFYGLIEQIDDESKFEDDDQAAAAAEEHRKVSNPTPLYINVPEGARLSPDAAVCFSQLVPGTLMNVIIRDLCREVYSQFKLTAVRTHVNGEGDEEVGITLSPVTHDLPLVEDE